MNKAEELAKYEIGWWKAHHRGDVNKLLKEMANVYVLLFGLDSKKAKEVVSYRVKAAKFHDKAEEYEDNGNQREADKNWKAAEKALKSHFSLLEKHILK